MPKKRDTFLVCTNLFGNSHLSFYDYFQVAKLLNQIKLIMQCMNTVNEKKNLLMFFCEFLCLLGVRRSYASV